MDKYINAYIILDVDSQRVLGKLFSIPHIGGMILINKRFFPEGGGLNTKDTEAWVIHESLPGALHEMHQIHFFVLSHPSLC